LGGRMPPLGANWLKMDDEGLSKTRPIALRDLTHVLHRPVEMAAVCRSW